MDKILKMNVISNYRIVAISDIHGSYDLLKRLIDRAKLKENDYLIILGDAIQKGEDNRKTLDYIKELSKRNNTIILTGNHERYILGLLKEENAEDLAYHLNNVRYPCIIKEWINELGIEYKSINDIKNIQTKIVSRYQDYIRYMMDLPIALELDEFIFVHAGIDDIEDWTQSEVRSMLSISEFLEKKHSAGKYVVVGHWPTQNYRERSLNGDVIIDNKKKIIAIDGGNGVKYAGQVNALIIEKKDNQTSFNSISEDKFEIKEVVKDFISEDNQIVKLDWRDLEFDILKEDCEFSLCKKASTGERFLLKNEFIDQTTDKPSLKKTYISLFLDIKKGNQFKVIEKYGGYVLGKYKNEVGWVKKDCINL
ncbi:metallophosphoesterase [Clostridiaceae bacterium M8S5]|nr:metallophosphoesterase [Clostridiaceae bacterium M8S5]